MQHVSRAATTPHNRYRVSYENPVTGTKTHWYLPAEHLPADQTARLILALAKVATDRTVTITLVGETDAVEETAQ